MRASSQTKTPPTDPLRGSRQLVVVTSSDWTSITGTLQRYERKTTSGPWGSVGEPFLLWSAKMGLRGGAVSMASHPRVGP
jgi:hypothetical protein